MKTFLATIILCLAANISVACSSDKVTLQWEGVAAEFTVDVVDTPASRAKGLMFVESMPRFNGMLFVYPEPQPQIAFWMRNTLISLDILFFDQAGILKTIQANAVPLDETSLPGGTDIQYVLEINGGLSERLRIPLGASLTSPFVSEELAKSPCPNTSQ